MPSEKIQTGIRFRPEVLSKLTMIAKTQHRSLNAQLEHLAEDCIKQYERENGEIELFKANE